VVAECCCGDISALVILMCALGLAKANKDILVNDRLVDGAASDGMV